MPLSLLRIGVRRGVRRAGLGGPDHEPAQVGRPAGARRPGTEHTGTWGADGSVVKSIDYAVVRIEADGYVRRLAGAPFSCEENGNPSLVRGLVDGPADTARFNMVSRVVSDPHGNVWVVDQRGCAVRRIAPDGHVTTVIGPDKACAKSIAAEDRVGLHELAWDAVHGELVSSASFTVAEPVHNMYNTVWRIRPNGEFRRVLYSHKVGRSSPAKHYLDGIWSLAVDPEGRIHIGSKIMARSGASVLAVLRVDEAGATVVPVTGAGYAGTPWVSATTPRTARPRACGSVG